MTNTKTISPDKSGFPDYLDFNKLREQSINYLGDLAGKIWTDHNLHDPGITTLEMLCYALLDLGYRTNFPAVDIFSRSNSDTGSDNNFLTPSELLTCNPLTVTDYRKLLIDIEGVRNAWLEKATDVTDICRQVSSPPPTDVLERVNNPSATDCITFLNGLYHVYLELEEEKTDPAEKKEYEQRVTDKARTALMQHRNVCEDFADIYILCKQDVGICADIELDAGGNAETVYTELVTTLQEFLDPAPRFYTLSELLDKQKPIEEIFAGRPYNIVTSHGFIDTEELEELELRKEIHLSDLYQLIMAISGVRTVRRLQLQVCQNNKRTPAPGWKFSLPKNTIPVFSTACSTIQFVQSGKTVQPDFSRLNQYLDLRLTATGKIMFREQYPYLDAEIPKGLYRGQIDDYYSIQNEYPRVYGIGEGGLPDDAPAKRKAQALQFKGYLLFFDQLLANYLSQLKNIRSLFSLNAPGKGVQPQTYFWQQPETIPDFEKLLRYDSKKEATDTADILALPVSKKDLFTILSKSPLKASDIEGLATPYYFSSEAERDFAIGQLIENFQNEAGMPTTITTSDAASWFYFETFSDEWVLLSKKYCDEDAGINDLDSVQYLGTSQNNYSQSISPDGGHYSFAIDSSLSGYLSFLRQIGENDSLYLQRRNDFLNHLLARFSEQFTDFALVSFTGMDVNKKQQALILAKENFLSNYGVLSSNRGRAADYLGQPFSPGNVSGFEKRLSALAGWNNCGSVSLCNFVVEEFEEQFIIQVKFNDETWFSSEEKFYSKEQAEMAVRSLFNALQSEYSYEAWHDKNEDNYKIRVHFAEKLLANVQQPPSQTLGEANRLKYALYRAIARKPVSDKVFTSKTVFRIVVRHAGEESFYSKQFFENADLAREQYKNIAAALADESYWDRSSTDKKFPANIYIDRRNREITQFIDLSVFKIDVNNRILGKPDAYNFEILDTNNHFRIESDEEFDSSQAATDAAYQLLVDITTKDRFEIRQVAENNFYIQIPAGEGILLQKARLFVPARNNEEAGKIISNYAGASLYSTTIEEKDFRYRFNFFLDDRHGNEYLFRSIMEYDDPETARNAAREFYQLVPQVTAVVNADKLWLVKTDGKTDSVLCEFVPQPASSQDVQTLLPAVQALLHLKKELIAVPLDADPSAYEEFVNNDIQNKDQKYVYRLVDKDHLHAFYTGDDKQRDTEASAILKKNELFQDCSAYEYIEICLGGDIFCVRVDDTTGQLWYHYQLKVNHPVFPNQESVLFESVRGYSSEEEAQAAFDENYVHIMNMAMFAENYGKEKYISLEELLVHGNDLPENKTFVFVPRKTIEAINAYSNAQLIEALTSIAKKYPLRRITNDCPDRNEWKKRFPCIPVPGADDINCEDCLACSDVASIRTFYFYVLTDKQGHEAWQSVCYFATPGEARQRFHFFISLLCYPGNYYVNINLCDCVEDEKHNCRCKWEIYIREVLAESRNRYSSVDEAWAAVEEFICVSQTPHAFHQYFDQKRCNHSFFVACGNGGLIHPCSYYSEKKRNHVLDRLFKAARGYFGSNHISFFSTSNPYTVYDIEGSELGRFPSGANPQNDLPAFCSRFVKLCETIGGRHQFNEKDDGYYLIDPSGETIVFTNEKKLSFEKWQEELKEVAYFFPVVKSLDESGKPKYCVEIKFPHFNHRKNDDADDNTCGCDDKPVRHAGDCWCAWKSDCCFATCAEALSFYFEKIPLLLDYHNYCPVIECDCSAFRIELIPSNAIIAVNPQSYFTVKDVCDAVDRAKCLINCEGLHLVEHILLRPRCEQDCRCDYLQKVCDNELGCEFEWENGDQLDPCNPQKKFCFVPGEDPYSFIATVALPAWTKKMRKNENQKIVEDLIYREAPAHVLVRILWLTPKDLFLFESHFKKWQYWLSWTQPCDPGYSQCDFLKFLFETEFKCLDECTSCLPCQENTTEPAPCFTDPCDQLSDTGERVFLNQVNEIYCWSKFVCGEETTAVKKAAIASTAAVAALATEIVAAPKIPLPSTPQLKKGTTATKAVRKKTIPISEEDVERKIDERFTRYRDAVKELVKSARKTNASEVHAFLQNYKPGVDPFIEIVADVIKNEKPKGRGKEKYSKSEQRVLVNNAVYYFFDNVVFNNVDIKGRKDLGALFKQLKQHKLLPSKEGWNDKEVKQLKPGASLNAINKLFKS